MNKFIFIAAVYLIFSITAAAQVSVSPDSINAYSQGATSAYLTFSNVSDLAPAEAVWCGQIIPAAPAIGFRCDPATVFGSLPNRYDQSRLRGSNYTDIMSITPRIARRAYRDAADGKDSRFYYVRHFVSTNGGPDQFVPVTIRLSGNGAGVPFSLTSVKLLWQNGEKIVPFLKPDEKLPQITAEILYTGTGRLKGRWEIVKPGDTPPETRDLLSEAALPPEERGTQRRYTLLKRFNVNLPPGGKITIPGPENWRIDKSVEGMYILLFRIEAGDALNTATVAGAGTAPTGAVAGFRMPTLRYYIGNSSNVDRQQITSIPDEDRLAPLILSWPENPAARFYRLEILDDTDKQVFSAIVLPPAKMYQLPSFIRELAAARNLKWRIIAVNAAGEAIDESEFAGIR